jgi:hypothetical protein
MDNKTHIQQGRSAAMENYVDFNGESTTKTTTPTTTSSAKDMKLFHIGIFVVGFAAGYLVCKMYK